MDSFINNVDEIQIKKTSVCLCITPCTFGVVGLLYDLDVRCILLILIKGQLADFSIGFGSAVLVKRLLVESAPPPSLLRPIDNLPAFGRVVIVADKEFDAVKVRQLL